MTAAAIRANASSSLVVATAALLLLVACDASGKRNRVAEQDPAGGTDGAGNAVPEAAFTWPQPF